MKYWKLYMATCTSSEVTCLLTFITLQATLIPGEFSPFATQAHSVTLGQLL